VSDAGANWNTTSRSQITRRRFLLAGGAALLLGDGYMAAYSLRRPEASPYLFGLIGGGTETVTREREAGIGARVFKLSWREVLPVQDRENTDYIAGKKEELQSIEEAGFRVILSPGFHDPPPWVHENYPDSYYVDQLGREYYGTDAQDNGEANLVFNRDLRSLVASYMGYVFAELGTGFYALRLGGGRYGELTFPPDEYDGESNLYWAYDRNAQGSAEAAGIPNWRPGDPSPGDEAPRFLDWYLGALAGYQNWQIRMAREAGYGGRVMMLYPGWGVRPGQAREAAAGGLSGDTPAETSGEIPRGHDFARQTNALPEPVTVTTTWLDAENDGDGFVDQRFWSPAKYLATLAGDIEPALELYGENTGGGGPEEMELSAHQMRRHGLLGMAWFNADELLSGRYADLGDYRHVIESSQKEGRS
jgi:hypothetical protein